MPAFKAAAVLAVIFSPRAHHCRAVTADMNKSNAADSPTHRRKRAFFAVIKVHGLGAAVA